MNQGDGDLETTGGSHMKPISSMASAWPVGAPMTAPIKDEVPKTPARVRRQALRGTLQEQTRTLVREAILDASEQAFLGHGFQSAKVADIAHAAGVSVGTVYNHFDGKESLFLALMTRCRNRYFAALEAECSSDNPIELLEAFVERSLGFIEDNRELFAAYLRETMPRADGGSRSLPNVDSNADEKLHKLIMIKLFVAAIQRGSLRDDMEVEELVWVLHSLLQATALEWLGSSSPAPLRARGRQVLQWFLQGTLRRDVPMTTGRCCK